MGKSSVKPESSSKADRKFEKKLQFYAQVRDVLAAKKALMKKPKLRSRQKKLKSYDLSSLSECLLELKAPRQPTPAAELKLNCKSRRKLILREGKQLNTVLSHPAFQADPLAAIQQHLESTQPVPDEKQKKKVNKNGSKKKMKNKSTPVPQPMDV